MEKPLISIIVPVYNVEKYLSKCLDSLLSQTLSQIEIICINDHSTDGSLSILSEYEKKDSRIKVVNFQENRKIGAARNVGLRMAQAEYIGFVDSDDWVNQDMYEKLYGIACSKNADIVAPYFYYSYYGENNVQKTQMGIPMENLSIEERNKHLIININGYRFWTSLFKKTLFFDNNLFFAEGIFAEDNAIATVVYLMASRIEQIDDTLYYYRQNNISAVRSFDNYNFFDRMEASEICLNHMKDFGFYERYREEVEFSFISAYYVMTLTGCFTRFSKPERKYADKVIKRMNELMPNFRKNKYYKLIPLKRRGLCFLCSVSFPLAAVAYRMVKFVRGNEIECFKQ